ncbi:MAG: FAD-binding protein [Nitrososphaerota archaeon]
MKVSFTYESDVLVVGAGGAGFRAAIEAASSGTKTILVNKGRLARSGATIMADSDLTVDGLSLRELGFFGEPRDTKDKFFNDIVTQGFYLNNQKMVESYVNEAPNRIKEMLDWGIFVESSEERALETPGQSIMDALFNQAKKVGVRMIEDVMVTDLLTRNNKVVGAIGLNLMTGNFITFSAKAVVIATGGWHKAYDPNAGSRELSGDGIAMAYRAGAVLGNMEFVTFCANCVLWPRHLRGSLFTYIMHMITRGPLYNGEGKNILEKYDPFVVEKASGSEWNKCVISNMTYKEVLEGRGSEHGGVYYSVSKENWPQVDRVIGDYFPGWKYRGGDFSELRAILASAGKVEVAPAAEYFEGGIYVDIDYKSTLDGLYAAGESAMSLFGANRVVAATTEMLVTGAIAGRSAANFAKANSLIEPSAEQVEKLTKRISDMVRVEGNYLPGTILSEIQENSYKLLGPIRNKEGLERFLSIIRKTREKISKEMYLKSDRMNYNLDLIEAIELNNIVELLELSATAALKRTESRGVHYRSDFPFTDNGEWLKQILISNGPEGMRIYYEPVTITKMHPDDKKHPYMEMVKELMKSRSDITGGH